MKSATVAGKGVESINSEIYSYLQAVDRRVRRRHQGGDGFQVGP